MPTREERIRERLFPKVATYDRKGGGFAALPLILRRAQFLFEPRRWQVYTYIIMRAGPAGVAWFPLSEMAWDLGFASTSKLKPYVDALVADRWIERSSTQGRDYYIARNPVVVLTKFRKRNALTEDRVEAIDELLEALSLPTIGDVEPSSPAIATGRPEKAALPVSSRKRGRGKSKETDDGP